MEGILILIGVWLLDIIIKKVAANRKKQQQMPQYQPNDEEDENEYESRETKQEAQPPRSLQDLIRQFEKAQNEAEQGNIEPPTPPVEKRVDKDDPYLPHTLRELAEEIIESDVVDAEYLMDEFEMTEGEAISALEELEKLRVIGRDMGGGEHDVLVHDSIELDNLFHHERQPQYQISEEAETKTEDDSLQQELERQRKLNELEDRARSARETAAESGNIIPESDEDGITPRHRHAPLVSTRSIADVRKGFIWAKVLDEPRFKRRWSTQYR